MIMKDMEKTIQLRCDVCGNDQFSTVDEDIYDLENAPNHTEVKCCN